MPPEKKNTTPSVGPRKLPRDPQGFAELPGASGTSEVLPRAAVSRMGTAFFFLMKPSWILYNQVYESNICNHIFLAKMQLSIFHVNYSLQVMLPPTKKSILMLQQTNQLKKSPQLPWTSVLMHFGWAASTVYTKKCEVSLKSKILVRSQGE